MTLWLTVALNALQSSIVLLVLAFSPPNSLIRPALFPLLIVLTLYILPLNRHYLPTKLQSSLFTHHTVGIFLQYLDCALISRWSFSTRGPTSGRGGLPNTNRSLAARESGPGKEPTVWSRLKWGLFAITAWRYTATPWEVKNVPPFDPREPKRLPSRSRFLGDSAMMMTLCLIFLDLMSLGDEPEKNPIMFAAEKVGFFTRLSEISVEEAVMRVVVTLAFWFSVYCVLQAFYTFMAVIAVDAGVTTIDEWPPLFGSVKDCYSIRQFWGSFWHQSYRQKIGSPAYYTVYSLLGLRKGSLVARYTLILISFTVSGLVHVAEEYGAGVSLHQSNSMRFYCMQTLGIMLEDGVQALFHSSNADRKRSWTKAVGYIWVILWISWSSPAWYYPKLRLNNGSKRDQILPFSLLGRLLS